MGALVFGVLAILGFGVFAILVFGVLTSFVFVIFGASFFFGVAGSDTKGGGGSGPMLPDILRGRSRR